jgi:hypothetical protein
VDVAKQLDERDAAHKAEVEQLKGRIAALLDERRRVRANLRRSRGCLSLQRLMPPELELNCSI